MIVLLTILIICEPITLTYRSMRIYYDPIDAHVINPCWQVGDCSYSCTVWWTWANPNGDSCIVRKGEENEPANSGSQRSGGYYRRVYYDPVGPCLIHAEQAYKDDMIWHNQVCLYENPNYTTPTSPFTEDPNPAVRIYGNPATILMLFPLIHEKYVGAY